MLVSMREWCRSGVGRGGPHPAAWLVGVGVLVVMVGCKGRSNTPAPEEEGTRKVRLDPSGERPMLEFPKAAQSDDASMNRFIEEFYDTCCKGEYDKFRLMMSTRVDPFAEQRFKKSLVAIERVQIEGIERLPDVAEIPPPIYVVRSRVKLRPSMQKPGDVDRTNRTIAILVFKEAGKWVMAPAPKSVMKDLDLLAGTESQPAAESQPAGQAERP
jgi:hypothetical protein